MLVDHIVQAFKNLGGSARLSGLYAEVRRVRGHATESGIRNCLQLHSSDCENYKKDHPDYFFRVGIGRSGHWGLRDYVQKETTKVVLDGSTSLKTSFEPSNSTVAAPRSSIHETSFSFSQEENELLSEEEESRFPEGAIKYRIHRERERDTQLARRKKIQRLQKFGILRCDVCDFCFTDAYGAWASLYIEAHHDIAISKLKSATKTKLSDLTLVCANCHRMLHHKRPWLTVERLRKIVLVQRKSRKSVNVS